MLLYATAHGIIAEFEAMLDWGDTLEDAFDPLLPGSEQFKLQHSRAIDTTGTLLADRAFLQQSGMLAMEPLPSCARTPAAPPTMAITKMNDVSHFRILKSNCIDGLL